MGEINMSKHEGSLIIKSLFLVIVDIVAIAIASVAGLLLRFDFSLKNVNAQYLDSIWEYMPYLF